MRTRLNLHTRFLKNYQTVGKMLANGEKFMPKRTHIIWDKDGNKEFTFSVVYGKNKQGWIIHDI